MRGLFSRSIAFPHYLICRQGGEVLGFLGAVALGDNLLKSVTEHLTALPLFSLETLAILVLMNSQ